MGRSNTRRKKDNGEEWDSSRVNCCIAQPDRSSEGYGYGGDHARCISGEIKKSYWSSCTEEDFIKNPWEYKRWEGKF